jgi:predicted HTH domain antitoxin
MEQQICQALQRYRNGAVGMRGAADMAGLSTAEMMAEANDRKILSNHEEGDLADDVAALR